MAGNIRLSELCDIVVPVAPPASPLAFIADSKGLWWHDSSNWEYAPAGGWLVRNAAVDRNNAIGRWSPAVLMTLPLGWKLFGDTRNMPKVQIPDLPGVMIQHPDIAAIAWKAERISDGYTVWLVQGQRSGYGAYECEKDPADSKAPYPWSNSNDDPYGLLIYDRANARLPTKVSDILTFTPGVPSVWLCEHKLEVVKVASAWVTHSGETDLSPWTVLGTIHPPGVMGYRRLCFSSPGDVPLGVLGYYLYLEISGQPRRQLSKPWFAGTPGNDKYLYQPDDLQPILWTSLDDTPIHVGGKAWSIVSPAEQALRSPATSIIIDDDAYIYAPLVDPMLPGSDPADRNRSVSAPGGGGFSIEQRANVEPIGDYVPANDHPTYWPIIVESCDELQGTRWAAPSFKADMSRGPGACKAVTFRDRSGGGGFKARFERPIFSVGSNNQWPWRKTGFYIGWENANYPGGHNASEIEMASVSVFGDDGINVNGTQAVNIYIDGLHVLGLPAAKMKFDGCEVWLKNVKVAAYDTLIEAGWITLLHIDKLFVDRAGHSLVDFTSHEPGTVRIDKVYLKTVDFLTRSPMATSPHHLTMRDRVAFLPGYGKMVSYGVLPDTLQQDFAGSEDIEAALSSAVPSKVDAQARYPGGVIPGGVTP